MSINSLAHARHRPALFLGSAVTVQLRLNHVLSGDLISLFLPERDLSAGIFLQWSHSESSFRKIVRAAWYCKLLGRGGEGMSQDRARAFCSERRRPPCAYSILG